MSIITMFTRNPDASRDQERLERLADQACVEQLLQRLERVYTALVDHYAKVDAR